MKNGKSLSLIELFRMFPDDETAEKLFQEDRWGKTVDGLPVNIHCPHCGCCGMISECPNRKPMPYWCGDCRKRFSVRTGGTLSHSPIPYQKWAISLYLYQSDPRGISSRQLARYLGITQKSAWFMLHRIREGWGEQESLNSSEAEMDESWFGGKDDNRHGNKKFHLKWRYGRVLVAGMRDRETGNVAAKVILNSDRETLFAIAEEHLCPEGTLYSDNAAVYSDFGWPGRHETVNHKNEYVRGDVHTNGIESFWAEAKQGSRTYRHVSPKHCPRYLKEFAGRHNVRGMDTLEQMELLVSGMMRNRLTYRNLLDTEVPPVPYTHHRSKERASLFE